MAQQAHPFPTLDLGYPPWAMNFDPLNRGYLVVGGGGGAGQKEVPNRLSLIDVSAQGKVVKVAESDVTDDSPASLGATATKDGLVALAGVNSNGGKHLRSFDVKFPAKTGDGKISSKTDSKLFGAGYTKDAFQRVLRLSPATCIKLGRKQLGVIASSFSKPAEVIVFDANTKETVKKIDLKDSEANDVDLIEDEDGDFLVAYCTSKEIFVSSLKATGKSTTPTLQHSLGEASSKFRCIRFLSKHFIIALVNMGSRSVLEIIRIYPEEGNGAVALFKSLAGRFTISVSMDICLLNKDHSTGAQQVIVAVAAQKTDVNILTIDMPIRGKGFEFDGFQVFRLVHRVGMKKVALSPFFAPQDDPDNKGKSIPRQSIRLASISLSNNLVVQTIPLKSIATRSGPRYVLKTGPSKLVALFWYILVAVIALLIGQVGIEQIENDFGYVTPFQLVPNQIKVRIKELVDPIREDNDPIKYAIHEVAEGHIPGKKTFNDLFNLHGSKQKKAIVIAPPTGSSPDLVTEVHEDHAAVVEDPNAKKWDELTKSEQSLWKKRLQQAGQWSSGQGEAVLKSVFFAEVAGAVGRAVLG